jgi:hypothetical protein
MRNSPTILEKLINSSKRYAAKTLLASAVTLSSYGCSPAPTTNSNNNSNEPDVAINDNSSNVPSQQQLIINTNESGNVYAQLITADNNVVSYFTDGEKLTDIKVESNTGEEAFIKLYGEESQGHSYQDENGYGHKVNEWLNDNEADITYFSPDGTSARVIVDISKIESSPTSRSTYGSNSCSKLEEFISGACEINNLVGKIQTAGCVVGAIVDFIVGGPTAVETAAGCAAGAATGFLINEACDNIFDCDNFETTLESIIDIPPPQFSPGIVVDPPLPESDKIVEGRYREGSPFCLETIDLQNLGIHATSDSTSNYIHGYTMSQSYSPQSWIELITENGLPTTYISRENVEMFEGLEEIDTTNFDVYDTVTVPDLQQNSDTTNNSVSYILHTDTDYSVDGGRDLRYNIGEDSYRCAIMRVFVQETVNLSQPKNNPNIINYSAVVKREYFSSPHPTEWGDLYDDCGIVTFVSECEGTMDKD